MALDPAVIAERMAQSPVIQGLLTGDTPPVYGTPDMLSPDAQQDIPGLQSALSQQGLGFVQAPTSQVFVLFNPSVWSQEEILAADEAGTLDQIAAPLSGAGAQQPGAAPTAPAPAPIAAGLAGAVGAPSAGSQTDLTATRTNNVITQPPTRSASPASGQIFNGLIKRAV